MVELPDLEELDEALLEVEQVGLGGGRQVLGALQALRLVTHS